jgi:pilus assembly protein CpaB
MLTGRAVFMFGIAVVLAVAAAWLANNWVQARVNPVAKAEGVATTSVVAAAFEIPYGERIQENQLRVIQWPAAALPEGVFQDVEEVHGKIAMQTILPGELVMQARVAEHLGGSALAALVTPQMRAITVRVNDVAGVAGFLLPGNRVDVLATRNPSGRGNAVTRTVLEDLRVLAVDQTASSDRDRPVVVRAVTLEVSPEEAETLVKASNEGPVQLALRNPLDKESVVRREEPRPTRVRAPAPQPTVTVIRGSNVSVVQTDR